MNQPPKKPPTAQLDTLTWYLNSKVQDIWVANEKQRINRSSKILGLVFAAIELPELQFVNLSQSKVTILNRFYKLLLHVSCSFPSSYPHKTHMTYLSLIVSLPKYQNTSNILFIQWFIYLVKNFLKWDLDVLASNWVYCGEGTCKNLSDYVHVCECKPGAYNLFNISHFPIPMLQWV